jgi:hypothetical protein
MYLEAPWCSYSGQHRHKDNSGMTKQNAYFLLSRCRRTGIHRCRDAKNGKHLRHQQCTLYSVPTQGIIGCVFHLNPERIGLLIERMYHLSPATYPMLSVFSLECRNRHLTPTTLSCKAQDVSMMDASCTNCCIHWVSGAEVYQWSLHNRHGARPFCFPVR